MKHFSGEMKFMIHKSLFVTTWHLKASILVLCEAISFQRMKTDEQEVRDSMTSSCVSTSTLSDQYANA